MGWFFEFLTEILFGVVFLMGVGHLFLFNHLTTRISALDKRVFDKINRERDDRDEAEELLLKEILKNTTQLKFLLRQGSPLGTDAFPTDKGRIS